MAVNRLNQVQRPVQVQIQHLQQENMDAVSSTPFETPYQRRMHSHWQRNCIFLMSCKRRDGISLKQLSTSTLLRATKAKSLSIVFHVGRGRKRVGGLKL